MFFWCFAIYFQVLVTVRIERQVAELLHQLNYKVAAREAPSVILVERTVCRTGSMIPMRHSGGSDA